MPAKLAHLAGLAALVVFAVMVALEITADIGGPGFDATARSIMTVAVLILAVTAITQAVIYTEISARPEVDADAIAVAIKEQVAELFTAALEEAVSEIYRVGMVHGAERVGRARLVPVPREE